MEEIEKLKAKNLEDEKALELLQESRELLPTFSVIN